MGITRRHLMLPRRMPTAVIASSTIATREIQARATPIWANREPIPIAPPRAPAVTIRACPAPPAAAAVVVAEPEAMATSRPRAPRSEARAAVIIRIRGSAAVARGAQMGQQQQPRVNHGPRTNGQEVTGPAEGVLELHPKGYGFLRDIKKDYAAQETDAFVSSSLIEKYSLRPGILIRGEVGPGSNSQGPRLRSIESVDGRSLEDYAKIKKFDELTAINPFEHIKLETGPTPASMRVMDLLTPIGKGQRALIVAPRGPARRFCCNRLPRPLAATTPKST